MIRRGGGCGKADMVQWTHRREPAYEGEEKESGPGKRLARHIAYQNPFVATCPPVALITWVEYPLGAN